MAGNLYEQGYYEAGTASVTQGQTVVTGQGTAWSQIVRPADDFGKHVGMPIPIASVDSDTQITLAYPWPGPTQAAAPYRVTFTPYHVAYRQALQEIGQLLSSGNVSALAGLVGAANKIPIFTGPGALEVIAKQDLVNGVRFDVQVADLAGRAAYDNEAAGFTVLVADVGDGRSAVYTKNSVAAADWSDPAYITGPTGATGSPWEDWQGAWATATAYDKLAGVENNGSSYICTTAHTSDAASEPGVGASWQTYWDLVAAKGLDGDIVGPNGATDGNVALFDGITGKVLKDGGALGTAAFTSSGDYVSVAGAGALSGFRNKIINGDFSVNQRPIVANPGAGQYMFDRWLRRGASGSMTYSQQTFTPGQTDVPDENGTFGRFTFNTTPGGSCAIEQRIEALREFSGKLCTLTLYAKADIAKDVEVRLGQNFGSGGSPAVYQAWETVSLTTSFQRFDIVVNLPSIVGKTIGASSYLPLQITIAGNPFGSGVLPEQSIVFDIARVSVVKGDATAEDDPFSPRHIQQELALCQRYYWRGLPLAAINTQMYAANALTSFIAPFPVPMRGAPTLSQDLSGSTWAGGLEFHSWQNATIFGGRILVKGTAVTTNANVTFGANDYFEADAEIYNS